MTDGQIAEYRQLLERSLSPRARRAEADMSDEYVFLRGFNSGLDQAAAMLNKVLDLPFTPAAAAAPNVTKEPICIPSQTGSVEPVSSPSSSP